VTLRPLNVWGKKAVLFLLVNNIATVELDPSEALGQRFGAGIIGRMD